MSRKAMIWCDTLVCMGVILLLAVMGSATINTAKAGNDDIDVEMPPDVTKLHDLINMKHPLTVRYTGAGGNDSGRNLDTWIIYDKVSGARVLVVTTENHHETSCILLPTVR